MAKRLNGVVAATIVTKISRENLLLSARTISILVDKYAASICDSVDPEPAAGEAAAYVV